MRKRVTSRVWSMLKDRGIEVRRAARCSGMNALADIGKLDGRAVGTVFDVGANVGQSALAFADAFPRAAIHCFEPAPASFRTGRQATSHLPHVTWHETAVGHDNATVEFFDSGVSQTASLAPAGRDADGYTRRTVPIIRLDDFCARHDVGTIDLLKTDTEGFDLGVLQGAERLLRRGAVRHILCEVGFSTADKGHSGFAAIAEYLERFDCRLVHFYGLSPVEHFRNFGCCYGDALFARIGAKDDPGAGA